MKFRKLSHNSRLLLVVGAVFLGIGTLLTTCGITAAYFSKSQEIKNGNNNLVVESEGLLYSFKVQLHNTARSNAGEGQNIYAIFYNATNGVNHANTKYTYIRCNQTRDNVTMEYSIKGIGALTQNRVMLARINPNATFNLADVASTVASESHATTGCVWQISTPVEINVYNPNNPETYRFSYHDSNDVYRVYWANEESTPTYYHLEMNPQGTANYSVPS